MSVYFVSDGTAIKIGHTDIDVSDRISALQTGNPRKIFLVYEEPGGMKEEKEYQLLFADLRIAGEWFRVDGDLADFLIISRLTPCAPDKNRHPCTGLSQPPDSGAAGSTCEPTAGNPLPIS